jgi:hypothetical protein
MPVTDLKTCGPPHYGGKSTPEKRRERNKRYYLKHQTREQEKARTRYWKKKLEGYE